jgi:hypothetical protein
MGAIAPVKQYQHIMATVSIHHLHSACTLTNDNLFCAYQHSDMSCNSNILSDNYIPAAYTVKLITGRHLSIQCKIDCYEVTIAKKNSL